MLETTNTRDKNNYRNTIHDGNGIVFNETHEAISSKR